MDDLQLARFSQTWQKRQKKKLQDEQDRRAAAMEKAAQVSEVVKSNYGARKVYLYGSLIWGKHFTVHSDIDLLVEGFPKDADYWEALATMEHLAAPFPISLVLAESAVPSLVKKAKEEGKQL